VGLRDAAGEPGAKAPVAFLVHGGPQGSLGDAWSYRWNPPPGPGTIMPWSRDEQEGESRRTHVGRDDGRQEHQQ
jgi:hypothetical protein